MNYLKGEFEDNSASLARNLHMSAKSINQLAEGTQRPRLATVLKISAFMGESPLELITGSSPNDSNRQKWYLNVGNNAQQRHRKLDSDSILQVLKQSLESGENPPPPMVAVAERLGYDQSFLLRRFPAECHAISALYLQFRSQEAEKRVKELCCQVQDIARNLHKQGIYPSQYQIRKHVSVGTFKERSIRDAYHAVLKELGYQKQ